MRWAITAINNHQLLGGGAMAVAGDDDLPDGSFQIMEEPA
jgi:hypothetical protein